MHWAELKISVFFLKSNFIEIFEMYSQVMVYLSVPFRYYASFICATICFQTTEDENFCSRIYNAYTKYTYKYMELSYAFYKSLVSFPYHLFSWTDAYELLVHTSFSFAEETVEYAFPHHTVNQVKQC